MFGVAGHRVRGERHHRRCLKALLGPQSAKNADAVLAGQREIDHEEIWSIAGGQECVDGATVFGDVLHLQGKTHGYLLYLTIVGYHGSGVTYVDASVLVREYVTGALWQSMSGGIIRVTGVDGRSGSVKADLAYVGGDPTPPTVGLNVTGGWRCA